MADAEIIAATRREGMVTVSARVKPPAPDAGDEYTADTPERLPDGSLKSPAQIKLECGRKMQAARTAAVTKPLPVPSVSGDVPI